MSSFLISLLAFIVALGILVAVHEWGHFYVARLCGVYVERFSIGFGKPLWRKRDKLGTEYVLAGIPLGGYVRMLDERVDQVPDDKLHMAFNRKSVGARMAIIFAGPAVNFIFAVFALLLMYLIGITTIKPVVGKVDAGSIAEVSGLNTQDEILSVNGRNTQDWEAVNLELVSLIGNDFAKLSVASADGDMQDVTLDLRSWNFDPDSQSALASLGIGTFRPEPLLTLAVVAKQSPAAKAGIEVGDTITAINGQSVTSWEQLVASIAELAGKTVTVDVLRSQQALALPVTIGARDTEFGQTGYLGVSPNFEPWPEGFVFTHQYGLFEALQRAVDRTWRLMTLSVEMIGKLLTGDVSVSNLSGPISIAQGAGASAEYGLVYFLSFLALISVNLGIINLLPLPMLDGGHLMYFTIEWLTGKPVPEKVQEWGFKIGGALLFMLMSVALFNDFARLG